MERAIREAGARQRWTREQSNALVALLIQHVGYLHLHGHALAMAQRVVRRASVDHMAFAPSPALVDDKSPSGYWIPSGLDQTKRVPVRLFKPGGFAAANLGDALGVGGEGRRVVTFECNAVRG